MHSGRLYRQKRAGPGSHTSKELIGCGRVCQESGVLTMSSQLGRCKARLLGRLTLIRRGSGSRFADRAGHRGLHSGPVVSCLTEEKEEPFPHVEPLELSREHQAVLSVLNITVQTLFESRRTSCGFRKLKCSFCWNVVRAVKHGHLRLKWRS